ncbi:unnamed protein product [Acidithrix sp. C25]|nr:unnamed protein product [Acidithrix sp. C25]
MSSAVSITLGKAFDASFPQSIISAFEGEHGGIMDDAVDHRSCDYLVPKNTTPA